MKNNVLHNFWLTVTSWAEIHASQIIIIMNFVVVSSVGIKKCDYRFIEHSRELDILGKLCAFWDNLCHLLFTVRHFKHISKNT